MGGLQTLRGSLGFMRKGQRGKKIGPSSSRAALSPKDRLRQQAYALRSQRDFVSAKPLLEELYKLEPDNIPLALDLGEAYMETEDFAAAVSLYAKMIERDPKYLTAVTNLGGALIRQGKLADAKAILQYALELDPQSIHARINLGGVLQASGDRKANLDNALEAVQIDPSSSLAFNNLGSAFSDMAMFKEAKHAYETAVMLDAQQVDALINLGAVEARLGDAKASCEMYEKVLTQLPVAAKQRADAVKFYAAFEYLKQGVLDKGWDYYEGGFSPLVPATGARTPRRNFNVPRWDGEPIKGKTLLVWREQGLGDELLFATCLHELEALGASIIVECDRRLVPVFERSFPNYKIRQETYLPNHGMVSPYSDFDLHVPLGSLMKYCRRDIKDFERSGAYIKTDPAKVAKFEGRLAPYKENYRLVGICWRSGKLDPVRNLGYTTLDEWAEVLQTPGFKFVNLQYGDCEAELRQAEEKFGVEILRWPDLNLRNDLDDIFALMHCLDAVASVQTAVLVMGGSVGVPTVGVKAGGWTRFGAQVTSSWYPSLVYSKKIIELAMLIEKAAYQSTLRELINCSVELAANYDTLALIQDNLQVFEATLNLCARRLLESTEKVAVTNYLQAFCYLVEKDFEKSEKKTQEVLRIVSSRPSITNSPIRKTIIRCVAKPLAMKGDWEKINAIEEELRKISSVDYVLLSPELARIAYNDGQFTRALNYAYTALETKNFEVLSENNLPEILIGCGAVNDGLELTRILGASSKREEELRYFASSGFVALGDFESAFLVMQEYYEEHTASQRFVQQMVATGARFLEIKDLEELINQIYSGDKGSYIVDLYSTAAMINWHRWGLDEAKKWAQLDDKEERIGLNFFRFFAIHWAQQRNYNPEVDYVFDLVKNHKDLAWLIYSDAGQWDILMGYISQGFAKLKIAESLWVSESRSTWPARHFLHLESGEIETSRTKTIEEYRKIPHHRNGLTLLHFLASKIGLPSSAGILEEDKKRKRYIESGYEQYKILSGHR
jgi:tetratricopeptide (TPR) repeat protein